MKCSNCDGTGQISVCIKCHAEKINIEYFIRDYSGDNEYGPYCQNCIGSMIPEKITLHSHDLTEKHNMDKLLADSRTRPTDPPPVAIEAAELNPEEIQRFPNPRCESKILIAENNFGQCDYVALHKGKHSHKYDGFHKYVWE